MSKSTLVSPKLAFARLKTKQANKSKLPTKDSPPKPLSELDSDQRFGLFWSELSKCPYDLMFFKPQICMLFKHTQLDTRSKLSDDDFEKLWGYIKICFPDISPDIKPHIRRSLRTIGYTFENPGLAPLPKHRYL